MKPFNHMSAYEFSEWKMSHMTKPDPVKLAFASECCSDRHEYS